MMRLKRRDRKGEEGFTLIELAIALAILGILVAIAVPTYLGVRNRAYDAEAKQAVGEIRAVAWSTFLEKGVWESGTTIKDLGFDDGDTDTTTYESGNWVYDVDLTGTGDEARLIICADGSDSSNSPTAGRMWELVLDPLGHAAIDGPNADCTTTP